MKRACGPEVSAGAAQSHGRGWHRYTGRAPEDSLSRQASMRRRVSRTGASRLSAVIVTYNSRDAVGVAMPALVAQLGPDDELVVVDNASADDTLDVVRRIAPDAVVVENPRNDGFSGGANLGARHASGDLLLFLNPDAMPRPGFLDAIHAPLG